MEHRAHEEVEEHEEHREHEERRDHEDDREQKYLTLLRQINRYPDMTRWHRYHLGLLLCGERGPMTAEIPKNSHP